MGTAGDGVAPGWAAATWRRAGRCSETSCVEVAFGAEGTVGVRDSKRPEVAVLVFSAEEWSSFLGGVRAGEFDAP